MPKFILERHMDAGEYLRYREQSAAQLMETAHPEHPSSEVKWLESIVTHKKIYDIYEAPKAELMMDHASYQGLPIRELLVITSILKSDQGKDQDDTKKML